MYQNDTYKNAIVNWMVNANEIANTIAIDKDNNNNRCRANANVAMALNNLLCGKDIEHILIWVKMMEMGI